MPAVSTISTTIILTYSITSVATITQLSSVAQSCPTLCDPMNRSTACQPPYPSPTPGLYPNSCPLSWWCHPTISSSVIPFSSHCQSFPESGSFQMSALLIRWPKYWSFSFNISPSNEHSGLVSFRMDWLDLLAVQGTLKSLLQHHSSKASILWRSAFFIVQLSHPYMTPGKTIVLTITRITIYSFLGAMLPSLQDLSSLTRDGTCTLRSEGIGS